LSDRINEIDWIGEERIEYAVPFPVNPVNPVRKIIVRQD
jgi:hypothetical protein